MATEIATRIPGTIPENERSGGRIDLLRLLLYIKIPEAVRKELMTLGTFMETVKILLHNY